MSVAATDPEQERDPPAEPTPITFPKHILRGKAVWNEQTSPPDFQSLFSKVVKPSDIKQQHVEDLNITILAECPVDELVPLQSDGSSYLSSLALDQDANSEATSETAAPDAQVQRRRRDLTERVTELSIENDAAYRAITRTTTDGVKPPRLAYMRKFWEGLESMAQYWDCSLDQYYEKVESDDIEESRAKRQKLESDLANGDESDLTLLTAATQPLPPDGETEPDDRHGSKSPGFVKNCSTDTATGAYDGASIPDSETKTSFDSKLAARTRMRYRGRRTATGRAMPDQFRVDMVKGFIEGAVWPFRTQVSAPRVLPVLQVNNLKLPIRRTLAVYRVPEDRVKARSGGLVGPILSVLVRPETDFQDVDGCQDEEKTRLNLMREIGSLLQIAQERRREGKTEVKAGDGKWWTTKRRWGGGPGGEIENEIGNSDEVTIADEFANATRADNGKKSIETKIGSKRKSPSSLWKELKGARGTWDPKIEYRAIGKDSKSQYDEVWLYAEISEWLTANTFSDLHGLLSQSPSLDPKNDHPYCIHRLPHIRSNTGSAARR